MTTQSNISVDDWKTLREAPLFVAGAVAAATPSGMIGEIKEGLAIVNSITSTAKQHPNNRLIQEVIPKSNVQEQFNTWKNAASTLLSQSQSEHIISAGMVACQHVNTTLQAKSSPQEGKEFKQWLLEIGERVAQAANEGGPNASAMSPEEAKVLNDIYATLGMSSQN
jgi:hypothetical protein